MQALSNSPGALHEMAAFLAAFLLGLGAIILLRRCWTWHRGLDPADGVRKRQSEPVLRIGGLALYAVFAVAFVVLGVLPREEPKLLELPFFLLGTTLFLLGFADDLFGLPASVKLFVQIGVGIAAHVVGMRVELISHPLGLDPIDPGAFGLVLTVLWFVALPNLINLVDGMDGLAGGIALFLCLTLATVGAISENHELLLFHCALAGGIVAFLVFNLPPARVYMGDGGAYLLGYLIAASSMLTSNKGSIFGPLLVVVIVLGFPILDTGLAMARRLLSGLPVTRPDALHLHHRLQTLGFSKRNILFALYGIFAGLSLLALSVFLSAGYTLPIVGMIATLGILQGLRLLGLPHSFSAVKRTFRDLLSARRDVRYAYAMSLVLEHELDRAELAGVFWSRLRECLDRFGIVPLPGGRLEEADPQRKVIATRLDDHWIWVLHCPRTEGEGRRWERVARCFSLAIAGAKARWGEPLPEDLGFVDCPSEEAHAALVAALASDPSGGGAKAAGLLGGSEPARFSSPCRNPGT
jgi:UDP-GlcNAc:undecaprenyl-phosphate GlcNAc-1-phosphate transferase